MKIKEVKFKTIIDLIFIGTIILFIFLALIKSIINPNEIIDGENRYADSYNKITFSNYLKGELQTNFEKTLSDQMILSSKMKLANNMLDAIIIKNTYNKIYNQNKKDYYNLGSVLIYGKDNLVYSPRNLDNHKEDLKNRVNSLNKIIKEYPEVEYYFYYIEKDTDINFKDNSKLMAYEYIKDNLKSTNISRFEINNFEEFKKYFYKTDHHWNYEGSYKAYLDLLSMFDIKNPQIPKGTDCFNNAFWGSKAMSLPVVYNEKICYYNIDYIDIDTYINGEKSQYGLQGTKVNKNIFFPTYHTYYGLDKGEVIFDNKDNMKDNILIIGESFDNAIIRLLAEKFNKTISIDLRHFERETGNEFIYKEYIKKHDIDKVLFIGNINYWVLEEFNVIG